MTDEERFESFLVGFGPVAPPAGASERILAPALAAADLVDRRRRRTEHGPGLVEGWLLFLLEPLKAAALAGALVLANVAADATAPVLTADELTASAPVTAPAPTGRWLADPSTVLPVPVVRGREVAP